MPTKQKNRKEIKRKNGFKDIYIWLEPEASKALSHLQHRYPGQSQGKIISNALLFAEQQLSPLSSLGEDLEHAQDINTAVAQLREEVACLARQNRWRTIKAIARIIAAHHEQGTLAPETILIQLETTYDISFPTLEALRTFSTTHKEPIMEQARLLRGSQA